MPIVHQMAGVAFRITWAIQGVGVVGLLFLMVRAMGWVKSK